MVKVGFVSNIYGTPKGHSYVVNDMLTALEDSGHETHMLRILDNPIPDEFRLPRTVESYPERIIPEDVFRAWLEKVKPDYCIFMEYNQWWEEDHDKVAICKELGIKTVGFLVYEKLDWDKLDHYKKYTHIICPTEFQKKLCRQHGLYNAAYTPWGVNIAEIDEIPTPPREEGVVVFYHCAGSGGVGNRKNTQKIIEAYDLIKEPNTRLMISHLNNKIFSKNEIYSFMKFADVVINTAKWDTIGLNTLEANACGRPVIVADTNPMKELVINNKNGFRVLGEEKFVPEVTCPAYDVDAKELAKKMQILKNDLIRETIQRSSRKYAEANFDWEKNKKEFLRLFK